MLGLGKKKDKGKEDDSLLQESPEEPKGKKKKKDAAKDSSKDKAASPKDTEAEGKPDKKKGKLPKIGGLKNLFTKKRILIFFLLLFLGGGGYVGYTMFFAKTEGQPVYSKKKMEHVTLPEEMLRFCFDHFPPFYQALLSYNSEINIFNTEIQRIEAIGQKYPEQLKIADREKKVWEKSRDTLVKSFSKLEKPVREIYVLYQVNPEQGKAMVSERGQELAQTAEEALAAAREQSDTLKQDQEPVPDGFFQGLIYKVKKKFL